MKWEGRRKSTNVDDRRGVSAGAGKTAVGGGIGLVIALVIFLDRQPGRPAGHWRCTAEPA